MKRRDFISILLASPLIALPKPKTIFLPPKGGWPVAPIQILGLETPDASGEQWTTHEYFMYPPGRLVKTVNGVVTFDGSIFRIGEVNYNIHQFAQIDLKPYSNPDGPQEDFRNFHVK